MMPSAIKLADEYESDNNGSALNTFITWCHIMCQSGVINMSICTNKLLKTIHDAGTIIYDTEIFVDICAIAHKS